MSKTVQQVFEKLNKDGYKYTLLRFEIDNEMCDEDDYDGDVYYVCFTDATEQEDIDYQIELLKTEQCTDDTFEIWSTIDNLYSEVVTEVKIQRR